jgi:uncharacterized SAM-dependent methyltransferase
MHDLAAMLAYSAHNLFRSDIVEGVSRLQKATACRWLYDQRGSDLFGKIMRLETKRAFLVWLFRGRVTLP